MTAGLTFLSWVRAGLAGAATNADPLTTALPAQGTVPLGVTVNAWTEVTLNARLHGPGDVTGFDVRQVIRTEPRPDTDTFEPNYFPLVEFDRPDLPWLLTPAKPDARGRLRPWLVLVVVPERLATLRAGAEPNHLGVLTCPVAELPNLADSWAWAHAEVATGADALTVDQVLATLPDRTLSRLVCPRRLKPGERYVACVVPAFEPGRKTGLGLPLDATDATSLRPSWTSPGTAGAAVTLPVYYSWRFGTDLAGDVEALVRRLDPKPVPPGTGVKPMDIAQAGLGLPRGGAATSGPVLLSLEGALLAPGTKPTDWTGTPRDEYQARLRALVEGEPGVLRPPAYGDRLRAALAATEPAWFGGLNLDPRYRAAAALGTRVVQRYQEELLASAWEQAAAVEEANRVLRQGQLAREIARSVYERRIGPPPAQPTALPLSDDRLLQVTGAVHAQLRASTTTTGSVAAALSARVAVAASVAAPFRRVARPGGRLARRLLADPVALTPPVVPLAAGAVAPLPQLRAVSGLVHLGTVSAQRESLAKITAARVSTPVFAWEGATVPPPPAGTVPPPKAPVGFYADLLLTSWTYRSPDGFGPSETLVGRRTDFEARTKSWTEALALPGGYGAKAGPAVAAIEFDRNGTSDLLVFTTRGSGGHWMDRSHHGHLTIHRDATFAAERGELTGTSSGGTTLGGLGWDLRGIDVATGDVDGNGQPDVVVAWLAGQAPQNTSNTGGSGIRILWDMTPTGTYAASSAVPVPAAAAATISVALVGNVLFALTVESGKPVLRSTTLTRNATPVHTPWKTVTIGGTNSGDRNVTAALAVADWTGSAYPDLLLLRVAPTPVGYRPFYRVAWDVANGVPRAWSDDRMGGVSLRGPDPRVSVTVADLSAAAVTERDAYADRFRAASAATQTGILAAVAKARATTPAKVAAGTLAATVRAAVDPDLTVTSRVAARVDLGAAPLAQPSDRLQPLVVAPSFPQPMYAPLRDLDQERLLPGASGIADDVVTLVEANPRVIEAYLVGLNHELARELLWRGFPADFGATYFRQFWDRRDAKGVPVPDVAPVREWANALGANAAGGAATLLLLVRGELLRRRPDIAIYATRAVADGTTGRRPSFADADRLRPVFRGNLDPDVVFFGFSPLTAAQASGRDGGHGWYLVFQEHPTAARFGLDELPKAPAYGGLATTPTWADLHWGSVVADAKAHDALVHLPLAAVPATTAKPETGATGSPSYTWAHSAAHMAHITYQPPVQVAVHASDMLPVVTP